MVDRSRHATVASSMKAVDVARACRASASRGSSGVRVDGRKAIQTGRAKLMPGKDDSALKMAKHHRRLLLRTLTVLDELSAVQARRALNRIRSGLKRPSAPGNSQEFSRTRIHVTFAAQPPARGWTLATCAHAAGRACWWLIDQFNS
jgi:hypothetical protein